MVVRAARLAPWVLFVLAAGCEGQVLDAPPQCETAADCPASKVCSPFGTCVDPCTADDECADASLPDGPGADAGPGDAGRPDADEAADAQAAPAPDAADASLAECAVDLDCDDQNACTVDSCTGGACQHAAVAGTHLTCKSYQCTAVANTATACTNASGCAAAGNDCGTDGECVVSKCPFDAHDRYLDGRFPSFGLPYNDKWTYNFAVETITNPAHPSYTSQSCSNDSKGGTTRGSGHIRALHKGVIDVTLSGMSTAQKNLVKATLNDARGWKKAGLTFNFNTTFAGATDILLKFCSSCSVSTSGPRGSVTDACGTGEFPHSDSDYNLIQFAPGSCFDDLTNCSRWLLNHEVGHALGLADREHASLEGVSIMNHTHYYGKVWPSDDLVVMVRALKSCRGKKCITP